MSKRRGHSRGTRTGAKPIVNRQARFRYEFLEEWEAGIELRGSEVKSLRAGRADLKDAYIILRDGEVWMINAHIDPYPPAAGQNHEPGRRRKLLMQRYEIERLIGKTKESGLTVVPTRMFFKGPWAKVTIALARGKKEHDKRETMKERDAKREMERAMKERYR